jgi:hypothetical protein
MQSDLQIRDVIKTKIVQDLIEPSYRDDIENMIKGKKCWKLSGQVFETISKILVAIGSIISFSSGYFNDPLLGFLAGSISTMSLATLQFSSFAYIENKKQGQDLNVLLKKLNLDVIPVLERNNGEVQRMQQNYYRNSVPISNKTIYLPRKTDINEENAIEPEPVSVRIEPEKPKPDSKFIQEV